MEQITKESFDTIQKSDHRRICFAAQHANALKRTNNAHNVGTLNLPFEETLSEYDFPWELFPNNNDPSGNPLAVWRSIRSHIQYAAMERWIADRQQIVILRDCLTASAALTYTRVKRARTKIAQWIYDLKDGEDSLVIMRLVNAACVFLDINPKFKSVDYICAVPAEPSKNYHLPYRLAEAISAKYQLTDITDRFTVSGEKAKILDLPLGKKWTDLDEARISIEGDLQDKKILLIDDTYQSGTTMNYIAMILQQKGAASVYGLAMQKTLSDTGNR